MKKSLIILAIASIALTSCFNSNNSRNSETPIANETPEVLDENADISIKSVATDYKRSGASIIDKLFEEAMDKDPELKMLMDEFDNVGKTRQDSLDDYYNYIRNNEAYWGNVDYQLAYMNDTVLRDKLKEVFKAFELAQDKRMEKHTAAMDTITQRGNTLYDYKIIIKLLVTQKMMENYQKNELPDMKPINEVIEKYDSLIEVSEPHTEF